MHSGPACASVQTESSIPVSAAQVRSVPCFDFDTETRWANAFSQEQARAFFEETSGPEDAGEQTAGWTDASRDGCRCNEDLPVPRTFLPPLLCDVAELAWLLFFSVSYSYIRILFRRVLLKYSLLYSVFVSLL